MGKFKPRQAYQPQAQTSQVAEGQSAAVQTNHEDDVLQWAIRTFFDTLFKRSTDTISDEAALEQLRLVASEVSKLSADDRAEVIRDMDFFVGRIKSNIEPVLALWYRALK